MKHPNNINFLAAGVHNVQPWQPLDAKLLMLPTSLFVQ
jgi:hypothetical protein